MVESRAGSCEACSLLIWLLCNTRAVQISSIFLAKLTVAASGRLKHDSARTFSDYVMQTLVQDPRAGSRSLLVV